MIVECAGLPGSGKTTVCNLVTQPHGKKGAIHLRDIRMDSALLWASWKILLLCCATRPLTFSRLKRGFNLVVFLRHYQHRKHTILLDQGQIQKIWSILSDAAGSPPARLHDVLASLKPFAPDWVVWVELPVEISTGRVGKRTHGESRYDRLPTERVQAQLSANAELLRELASEYCRMNSTNFLEIDGNLAPTENAKKIESILKAGA